MQMLVHVVNAQVFSGLAICQADTQLVECNRHRKSVFLFDQTPGLIQLFISACHQSQSDSKDYTSESKARGTMFSQGDKQGGHRASHHKQQHVARFSQGFDRTGDERAFFFLMGAAVFVSGLADFTGVRRQ